MKGQRVHLDNLGRVKFSIPSNDPIKELDPSTTVVVHPNVGVSMPKRQPEKLVNAAKLRPTMPAAMQTLKRMWEVGLQASDPTWTCMWPCEFCGKFNSAATATDLDVEKESLKVAIRPSVLPSLGP